MRSNRRPAKLQAAGPPAEMEFLTSPGDVEIQAARGDDKLPTFKMLAYTGGTMRIKYWSYPVVVELSGLKIPKRPRPILKDHDPALVVGHTTEIESEAAKLRVAGVISGTGEAAAEVVGTSKNGFPWQASIGARDIKCEFVDSDQKAEANGQTFKGPVYIVRKATLGEISFVAIGADDKTSAKVAASAHENSEENDMKFTAWLKAKGFEPKELGDDQKKFLKAAYDAEIAAAEAETQPDTQPDKQAEQVNASGEQDGQPKKVEAAGDRTQPDPVAEMRASAAAESKRIASISKLCAAGKHADIEAKAIEEGWDKTKCELEVLRASRPTGPAIHDGDRETGPKVLEAAAMMGGGIRGDDLIKTHGEQVVEAADKQFRHGISLQQLLLEAAWSGGYTGRYFSDDPDGVLKAAFSTLSLPGILSNVANKFILAGFESVEQAWREITSIRPVKDLKAITSYRLTGDFEYQELGPDGELKHGTVGEESFTNQAKTYGRLFSITRTDLINDDLGALTVLPRRIGRGGALKINKVFWTAFMANAAFFKTANKNYASGATTALSIDALTAAILLFLKQTDADGNPVAVTPRKLLVPAALDVTATQLMSSLKVNETTTANKAKPTDNPHAGKFDVVMSRYLSDATISGYSSLAWHLLADPADLAVIETVFLNGNQAPTVERADANFNILGIQFRGYHDFGVALQEHRAGVKMKGEA